jgi:hypothetical protein
VVIDQVHGERFDHHEAFARAIATKAGLRAAG